MQCPAEPRGHIPQIRRDTRRWPYTAVQRIAEGGISQVSQVHPDLMGAPGVGADPQQRKATIMFQRPVKCYGRAAMRSAGPERQAVMGIANQVARYTLS